MFEHLHVIALPSREEAVHDLISNSDILLAVCENNLPRLQYLPFNSSEMTRTICQRFSDNNGASAGFSVTPPRHVVLTEKFFNRENVCQKFILTHELRHAHQSLVSRYWIQYVNERLPILRTVAGKSIQDVSKFLSAPLEFDAQEYALQGFPEVGSEIVRSRTQEVSHCFATFPNNAAATLPTCLEILPNVYEWARLLSRGLLFRDHESEIKKNSERILDFLRTHTLVGQDEKAHELCEEYVVAEPDDFLRIAKELYLYLLTLPN